MSVREITTEEFENWLNSGLGDEKLGIPWLLHKLVSASDPADVLEYDFQVGNRTFLRGFDGFTVSNRELRYIPEGKTIWEIGTQKTGLNKKLRDDCAKRLFKFRKNAREHNFRFVTPRKWSESDECARKANINSNWKSLKVYTSIQLVNWLNEFPWVRNLFCETYKLGNIDSLVSAEVVYKKYITDHMWHASGTPLPNDFVLKGREKFAEILFKWIVESKDKKIRILFDDYLEADHFIAASLVWGTNDVVSFESSLLVNRIIWVNGKVDQTNICQLNKSHIIIVPSKYIHEAKYLSRNTDCRIIVVLSKQNGDKLNSLQGVMPHLFVNEENSIPLPTIDQESSLKLLERFGLISKEKAIDYLANNKDSSYSFLYSKTVGGY